jgi:hypothetical protein
MTTIKLDLLASIPFLDGSSLGERFLSSLCFFDGEWHVWFVIGEADQQKLIKMQAWPAESCYFGVKPERSSDLHLAFIDFTGRIACFPELSRAITGLRDDILNLATSLAKVRHLHKARDQIPNGLSRMIVTEVEYIILVCRSIFDLLQEIIHGLWQRTKLLDASAQKRTLKASFARTMMSGDQVLSAEQMTRRFGLPLEIARCYERATDIFLALRTFRDNLIHNGSAVQTIFNAESGFLIAERFTPFPDLLQWRDEEREPNDLVPLYPALETLIYRTLLVCDDFTEAFQRVISFPAPIAPQMRLFLRGDFTALLVDALASGSRRAV